MPLATPEQYEEMLDTARRDGYAYPAVNVTSSSTLNAALAGFRGGALGRDRPADAFRS